MGQVRGEEEEDGEVEEDGGTPRVVGEEEEDGGAMGEGREGGCWREWPQVLS